MPRIGPYRIEYREKFTPAEAEELLQNKAQNRRISGPRVAAFSKIIRNSEWKDVPNPICILPNGQMANGQHRLAGLVLAGKELGTSHKPTIPLWFAYDVPPEVVIEMDRGRAQSLAETETILSEGEDGKTKHKTSIARAFFPLEGYSNSALERTVYHDILHALGEEHMEAFAAPVQFLTATVRAAFVFARPINPNRVDFLYREVKKSSEGSDNSTVSAIRRLITTQRTGGKAISREHLTVPVLKGIRSYLEGPAISRIRPEKYSGADNRDRRQALLDWFRDARAEAGFPRKIIPDDYCPDRAEAFLRELGLDPSRR